MGISAFDTRLLMSDMVITRAIHAANIAPDTFELVGDFTLLFLDGVVFRVTGSTANDGVWTCHGDSTFGAGDTTIHVTGNILDATADGIIEYWPEIAAVVGVSGPGLTLDTVDVTAHDSTGGWEEVVPTILRTGEVTLEINYDPAEATHEALATGLLFVMSTERLNDFELVFPDLAVTTWAFSAYVTGFEPGAPHEGKLSAAVSMKVTGVPVLV